MDFTEVTVIAEQLYRKRAECLFKMVNLSFFNKIRVTSYRYIYFESAHFLFSTGQIFGGYSRL